MKEDQNDDENESGTRSGSIPPPSDQESYGRGGDVSDRGLSDSSECADPPAACEEETDSTVGGHAAEEPGGDGPGHGCQLDGSPTPEAGSSEDADSGAETGDVGESSHSSSGSTDAQEEGDGDGYRPVTIWAKALSLIFEHEGTLLPGQLFRPGWLGNRRLYFINPAIRLHQLESLGLAESSAPPSDWVDPYTIRKGQEDSIMTISRNLYGGGNT
jgi:hypothetical protein